MRFARAFHSLHSGAFLLIAVLTLVGIFWGIDCSFEQWLKPAGASITESNLGSIRGNFYGAQLINQSIDDYKLYHYRPSLWKRITRGTLFTGLTITTLIDECSPDAAEEFTKFYSSYEVILGCRDSSSLASDVWNLVAKGDCVDYLSSKPTTERGVVHNNTYATYAKMTERAKGTYSMFIAPEERFNSSFLKHLTSILKNEINLAAIGVSTSGKTAPLKISEKSNVLWIEPHSNFHDGKMCQRTELLDNSFMIRSSLLRDIQVRKALESTPRQTLGLSYYLKRGGLGMLVCETNQDSSKVVKTWPRCLYDYLRFQIAHGFVDVIDSRFDPYNRTYKDHVEYCNMTRALQFRSQYKHKISSSPKKNIELRNPLKTLELASQALGAINASFFLNAGTLLGWYRQCGFIGYSGDLDTGMAIEHYSPDIVETMKQHGFELLTTYGKLPSSNSSTDGYEYTFRSVKNDLRLDIFFYYRDSDGKIWFGTWYNLARNIARLYFDSDYLDLKTIDFAGVQFLAPKNIEKALIRQYGPKWHVPVLRWSWYESPSNIYYGPFPRWPEPFNLSTAKTRL